jgi:hypothetical protein
VTSSARDTVVNPVDLSEIDELRTLLGLGFD